MGKYLKTKKGSIESAVLEAMSPAQQAAIAISTVSYTHLTLPTTSRV